MMNLFVAVLASVYVASAAEVSVEIDSGVIIGVSNELGDIFRGVPYAEPPIGDLRFAAPLPVKPWAPAQRNATEQAAGCMQSCVLPEPFCPPQISEDCLFVNVYSPPNPQGLLPVLVFFHGGNFKQGFNGGAIYNFASLANLTQSVVVVPQYRMGAFGFLYANEAGLTGNFGILDQRLALQWVQRNAAAFGGDKTKVTIAGQSAGGCSVMIHLVDTHAKGLFHQAIIESSACSSLPLRAPNEAQWLGDLFLKNISCSDIACLRAASKEQVLEAQLASANSLWDNRQHVLEFFQPYEPTYGTPDTSLTMQPLLHMQAGDWTQVPLLAGTVTDEAVPFVYALFGGKAPGWEVLPLLEIIFGPATTSKLLTGVYPIVKDQDAKEQLITLVTDFIFTCPTRNLTKVVALQAPGTVFEFRYGHISPVGPAVWGENYTECWYRCCHGDEIPLAYDTAQLLAPVTPDEVILTQQLSSYWGNFLHTGNPNTGRTGLPNWPTQSATTPVNLYMDTNELIPDYISRSKYCDFWDSVGYNNTY